MHGDGTGTLRIRAIDDFGLVAGGAFEIFDASGRRRFSVASSSPTENAIVASVPAQVVRRELLPGTYFVRYRDRDVGRLVVLR